MSTYSELHSAWEGQSERLAEAEYEIERQHGEIVELNGRLSDALSERDDLESVVDSQATDLTDTEHEIDRLSEAITSAIADLRVLGEVPLGDLEDAIKAIADALADKNGDLY